MPTQVRFAIVTLAALASAGLMWHGVATSDASLAASSAAAFAAVTALVGALGNWYDCRQFTDLSEVWQRQLSTLRHSGQLSALVYAWGAVAMLAMYKFAGLYWQHGLQYAAGMALFAALIHVWSRLARPGGELFTPTWAARAARLNVVHGMAAAIATALFLISGKLWVPRPDWAANIVFLAGGFAIMALCALAAVTHWCAGRTGRA